MPFNTDIQTEHKGSSFLQMMSVSSYISIITILNSRAAVSHRHRSVTHHSLLNPIEPRFQMHMHHGMHARRDTVGRAEINMAGVCRNTGSV
jgi:hypothetical protein